MSDERIVGRRRRARWLRIESPSRLLAEAVAAGIDLVLDVVYGLEDDAGIDEDDAGDDEVE